MDLVPTGGLAQSLGEGKPLDRSRVLRIARQVADALGHAHAHGILHRDMKPGNVLIDRSGNAHLTDFGLARSMMGDTLGGIEPPGMAGTAPYLSPALAEGRAEDTRSDIYGFGALLYEMLTGQPPFAGESVEAVRRQIRSGPPPPPIFPADGHYLLPIYHETGANPDWTAPDTSSLFLRFNPRTRDWTPSNHVHSRMGNLQPAVVELEPGHLLVLCRRGGDYQPGNDRYVVRTESRDAGKT